MIEANRDYIETLTKIDQIRILLLELQQDIYNQIPQRITTQFSNSKIIFENSLEEIEVTLIEFNNNKNE